MISVTALSGGLKASYYTGAASMELPGPERYYVHGGPGTWLGAGAAALGLSGRVEERPLSLLLWGLSPDDGSPLVQAQKRDGRRERQAGWSAGWPAPPHVRRPLSRHAGPRSSTWVKASCSAAGSRKGRPTGSPALVCRACWDRSCRAIRTGRSARSLPSPWRG